jgi:hypothetical protein
LSTTVTDEQIRELAQTAKPYSLALLWWGPEQHMDGAEATELEHQRRMVALSPFCSTSTMASRSPIVPSRWDS